MFDSFMPYELCINISNLVLCDIALVWFPDDGTLHIETGRNVQWNCLLFAFLALQPIVVVFSTAR
jgi:hypothetical protein